MEISVVRDEADREAVSNFKKYLRIQSVHPNINYDECIAFLEDQAKSLQLPYKIYKCAPDKLILVMTWEGNEPNLPTIWLNSHMDVVPVYKDKWTHDPFGADEDSSGNIYARGTQDMKSVGIQYLEAIRRLRKNHVTLRRTVHVAFVPEEELRGILGMKDFTQTEEFRRLNVGFALDEGLPSPNADFGIINGEKIDWKVRIHCPGEQGHGSSLMLHPPGNKIGVIINRFNQFRDKQREEFVKNPTFQHLGTITSLNLTMLEGGVQANVVPPEFTATFDIRIPASVDLDELEGKINEWCKEAGENVWMEFLSKEPRVANTKMDDSNPFWVALKKAADELKLVLTPAIMTGATDIRYIRKLGIPAFGFSPMNNTVTKAHDNDEYLNADVFLRGIGIYAKIIEGVSNV